MTKDLFGHVTEQRAITGEKYVGIVRHWTHAAVLFFDGEKEVWLPKSKIHVEERGPTIMTKDMKEETPVEITIPDWLAEEKGLID